MNCTNINMTAKWGLSLNVNKRRIWPTSSNKKLKSFTILQVRTKEFVQKWLQRDIEHIYCVLNRRVVVLLNSPHDECLEVGKGVFEGLGPILLRAVLQLDRHTLELVVVDPKTIPQVNTRPIQRVTRDLLVRQSKVLVARLNVRSEFSEAL